MGRVSARWRVAVLLAVAAITLAGAGAACVRDNAMAATSEDTALFEHLLWSTLHGRFAHNPTLDICHFADHCSFFLLVLLPFYWLAPHTETLFALQSFALASCLAPAFLLARRWLRDDAAAFLAALAVVLHPAVASQHVNQVHAPQFALPVLLWAAYLFERRRFAGFMIAAGAACLGKENLALAVFMFAAVAIVQRREWRWVLGPGLLAAGVLAAFIFVVAPALGGGAYRSMEYFGAGGSSSLVEIVRRALAGRRLAYLGQCLLFAGGALPLLGPMSLLALPELAINMTVQSDLFTVMHYHFSMTVGVFLTLGAVQGAARLRQWLNAPVRWTIAAVLALALLGNATWIDARPFRRPAWRDALGAALMFVPDDPNVSVLAPHEMLSAVCKRRNVYYIDRRCLRGKDVADIDVVILNLNGVAPRSNRQVGRIFRKGRGAKSHKLAFASDGVFVFVKEGL